MISYWIGVATGNHVAGRGQGRLRHVRAWPACGGQEGPAGRLGHLFTAIGQVQPGEAAEREMLPGMTGWYRRMRWLDARQADIYPLLDKFSFVTNRQHWGMYFRKSLFKVEENDSALVAEAMGVGNEFRNRAQP
jgi:hypothetical protein